MHNWGLNKHMYLVLEFCCQSSLQLVSKRRAAVNTRGFDECLKISAKSSLIYLIGVGNIYGTSDSEWNLITSRLNNTIFVNGPISYDKFLTKCLSVSAIIMVMDISFIVSSLPFVPKVFDTD